MTRLRLGGWEVPKEHKKLLVDLLFFLGAVSMFVFMAAIACTAIVKMFINLTHHEHSDPVPGILEGLEHLFLAPLGFLLFLGIWKYVAVVIYDDPDRPALSFLMRVKSLILGLIAAVAATDLLKRALTEQGLTVATAIAHCLFIVVIGGYSLLVEKFAAYSDTHVADVTAVEKRRA